MPVDFKRNSVFRRRHFPLLALAALTILFGCTSDEIGPVGVGLPIDMVITPEQTVLVNAIDSYGGLVVSDDDLPFDQNEVLYLGGRAGRASSILARYDFSALIDTIATLTDADGDPLTLTLSAFNSVTLRLFQMNSYSESGKHGGADKVQKHYEVYELVDTLDATLYPGAEPAVVADPLAISDETTDAVFIDLPISDLINWTLNGQTGILIRDQGSPSADLIGFAASELTHFLEIALEDENTLVGPTITVEFDPDVDHLPITFQPIADTSTLHDLADSPASVADGLLMRTHARRYPHFTFDLDFLEDDRVINRAVMRVGVDTLSSYGPLASLVLSVIPTSVVAGRDSLTVQEIEASAELITGLNSVDVNNLDAITAPWLGFDITALIQRRANGLLADEPLSFLLTSGEDFFSGYNVNWDPDFYLTVLNLYGTSESDYRPHLEITSTVFTGGGK